MKQALEPFSEDHYAMMRDMNTDRSVAVETIHAHYEKQFADVCKEAFRSGENRRDLILSFGIWAGRAGVALCLLLGIWYLCAWWVEDDQATLQGYMRACQSGDTVGCLEGVQDQEAQAGNTRARGVTYNTAADRAMRYRIAYRLKTGRGLAER